MTSKALKVGVSAVLDPAVTPHARTFMRALATARNHVDALAQVEFVFADDGADPETARAVARRFIAANVDLVIGHFSSDAAMAVRRIYREAGTPLLTPAATADAITDEGGVFRLCPPDRRLAALLLDHCAAEGWDALCVQSDDSVHGRAIAEALRYHAARHGITLADRGEALAIAYCGRLPASAAYLTQYAACRPTLPLILSDDAVSPYLPYPPSDAPTVHAIGFHPISSYSGASLVARQHRLLFGSEPETYFIESYAAFQIAAALVYPEQGESIVDRLAAKCFPTILGPVRFEDGEVRELGHAVWILGPDGFRLDPQREQPSPPSATALRYGDPAAVVRRQRADEVAVDAAAQSQLARRSSW